MSLTSTQPPAWFEKYDGNADRAPFSSNITIKRDHKVFVAEVLPKVSVSNMRSLLPKINNFKTDFLEREISIALLSEVWEKKKCKKQQYQFDKLFHLEGLKYISTPRTFKRGGGIIVYTSEFSYEKIDVIIPYKLEVVWGNCLHTHYLVFCTWGSSKQFN